MRLSIFQGQRMFFLLLLLLLSQSENRSPSAYTKVPAGLARAVRQVAPDHFIFFLNFCTTIRRKNVGIEGMRHVQVGSDIIQSHRTQIY